MRTRVRVNAYPPECVEGFLPFVVSFLLHLPAPSASCYFIYLSLRCILCCFHFSVRSRSLGCSLVVSLKFVSLCLPFPLLCLLFCRPALLPSSVPFLCSVFLESFLYLFPVLCCPSFCCNIISSHVSFSCPLYPCTLTLFRVSFTCLSPVSCFPVSLFPLSQLVSFSLSVMTFVPHR